MHKKLTITIDETIYEGLHNIIGRGKISKFLEDLARPHVVSPTVEDAFMEMASDSEREKEASEWIDNLTGDAFDETR